MTTKDFKVEAGLISANNTFVVNSTSGQIGINCIPTLCTLQINAADAILIPVGNTAQRPTTQNGMVRLNTDDNVLEYAANNAWYGVGVGIQNQNLSITAGVISWNAASGSFANVTLTANSANVANPTGITPGDYFFKIQQDGVGNRVINKWGSAFKWPGGVAPVLSTAANAVDLISIISDGQFMYGSYINNVAVPAIIDLLDDAGGANNGFTLLDEVSGDTLTK